jgi:cysteine desulfurase
MHRVYLDHNSTAPLLPEAHAAWRRAVEEGPGNPSSVHSFGHRARMSVEMAREEVAALAGAEPREIVFTASATEANNLALQGAALAAPAGRRQIVASGIEHPSVARVLDALGARGFDVVRVPPGRDGRVSADAILAAIDRDATAVVTLMLANHEIGTLQPVAEIGRALRGRGALLHTDAAQAAGRIPLAAADLGVDLMTLAAHKCGGPQGAGALFVRSATRLAPILHGGGQELNRRPGTENVPAVAAFGAAAAVVRGRLATEAARLFALRERLEAGARALDPGIRINGAVAPRLPNTSSLFVPGALAEELVIGLDLEGYAVSAGAACSSGTLRRSPTLLAMGLASEAASSVRVSLGAATTLEEVDGFLAALARVVTRVRSLQPLEAGR